MSNAAVELRDVDQSFAGRKVLDGCALRLEAGRIHGLIGRGGSGKTLLTRVISTLLRPDAGIVRLFGREVDWDDDDLVRSLRAGIGMQFQNIALFDFLDVFNNVLFPLRARKGDAPLEDSEERVMGALAAVGLAAAARHQVSELSGGMQRRVAIARALVTGAELLILDDPTGGLDPVTSSRTFDLIAHIHEQQRKTILVVSHDLDRLERICDRYHVLDSGRILFSGTLDEGRGSANPGVSGLLTGYTA